jgi:prophage regulatory protein
MSTLSKRTTLILSDEISKLIPYSQNHLRRLEAKGQFPKRIRIGANRVAWVESEIDSWIEDRVNARTEGVE